ncbi:DUF5956 family protein [Streptomyces sp. NBC_00162]|uniref:DUF5956 family protein n=1 Tax=Streptomyces sp. NBC_00162 TaxID=2903629 RepID=UPI00214C6925|nr:DUF5956 family protein [Streptomyces sp. NBC_00162]UUU41268.1 DUF5956 family protein [Streptomyces sp. NBC_00162]
MSWDEDGTPHPLALRRTGRSELEPDRLPEVRELEVLGWEPAPEGLRWAFLPYVWPPAARTWIPDRSTHWAVETSLDGHGHITGVEAAPLPEADLHDLDGEASAVLAGLGLPPRPEGRLWLLRPVGPFATVAELLGHLDALAAGREVEARASTEFLSLVSAELEALAAG